MGDGIRVEVHVRGCLGGDLLDLVQGLDPRVVPRHTVLTGRSGDPHDLVGLLHVLERAGVELERVST